MVIENDPVDYDDDDDNSEYSSKSQNPFKVTTILEDQK